MEPISPEPPPDPPDLEMTSVETEKTECPDVKELIISKCGLKEVILDYLQNEGGGMRVTVGVMAEEDAAILVRKINGLYFRGHQLYVEKKKKKKEPEQPYRPAIPEPLIAQGQPKFDQTLTQMQTGYDYNAWQQCVAMYPPVPAPQAACSQNVKSSYTAFGDQVQAMQSMFQQYETVQFSQQAYVQQHPEAGGAPLGWREAPAASGGLRSEGKGAARQRSPVRARSSERGYKQARAFVARPSRPARPARPAPSDRPQPRTHGRYNTHTNDSLDRSAPRALNESQRHGRRDARGVYAADKSEVRDGPDLPRQFAHPENVASARHGPRMHFAPKENEAYDRAAARDRFVPESESRDEREARGILRTQFALDENRTQTGNIFRKIFNQGDVNESQDMSSHKPRFAPRENVTYDGSDLQTHFVSNASEWSNRSGPRASFAPVESDANHNADIYDPFALDEECGDSPPRSRFAGASEINARFAQEESNLRDRPVPRNRYNHDESEDHNMSGPRSRFGIDQSGARERGALRTDFPSNANEAHERPVPRSRFGPEPDLRKGNSPFNRPKPFEPPTRDARSSEKQPQKRRCEDSNDNWGKKRRESFEMINDMHPKVSASLLPTPLTSIKSKPRWGSAEANQKSNKFMQIAVDKILFEMGSKLNIEAEIARPGPMKSELRRIVDQRIQELVGDIYFDKPHKIIQIYRQNYPISDDVNVHRDCERRIAGVAVHNSRPKKRDEPYNKGPWGDEQHKPTQSAQNIDKIKPNKKPLKYDLTTKGAVVKIMFDIAKNLNLEEEFARPSFRKSDIRQTIIKRLADIVVDDGDYADADHVLKLYRQQYPNSDDVILNREIDRKIGGKNMKDAAPPTNANSKTIIKKKKKVPSMKSIPKVVLRSVLKEEIKSITAVIRERLSLPRNIEESLIYDHFDYSFLFECQRMLFDYSWKRVSDTGIKLVYITGYPTLPAYREIFDFLTEYNCLSLRVSKKMQGFTASLKTFEAVDKLCAMSPINFRNGNTKLVFKHVYTIKPAIKKVSETKNKIIPKNRFGLQQVNLLSKDWQTKGKQEYETAEDAAKDDVIFVSENAETKVDLTVEDKETNEVKETRDCGEGNILEGNDFVPGDFKVVDEVRGSEDEHEKHDDEDWIADGEEWDNVVEGDSGGDNKVGENEVAEENVTDIGDVEESEDEQGNMEFGDIDLDDIDDDELEDY